jgi:hypothetical protein
LCDVDTRMRELASRFNAVARATQPASRPVGAAQP